MIADLFSLLARASLDISAAILVVLTLRRPARRLAGAALAYRLWLLVPVAAAAVALPPPPMSLSLFPRPDAQPAISTPVDLAAAPIALLDLPLAAGAAAPADARPILTLQSAQSMAVILWALGLAGIWTIVLVRQRRYVRGLGALTPEPGSKRVFLSGAADVRPALIGSLRAFVVLPRDFHQQYDDQQSALILAHERTHLAQRHHLEGALAIALVAAQWFNPMAYLAYRAFRIDQELACDAAVLAAHPRSRAAYAEAMLKSQISGAPMPFACRWPGKADHPLKERLTMLNSKAPSTLRRRLAGATLTLLLAGGAYVAYAAEPGAPERLAAQATGVVGSGDQLSLRVREAGGDRSLKVGDVYADGWTLKALTPSTVTIVRNGATMLIGLNPTGQVASDAPTAPPSTVTVVGLPDEATIQAAITRLGPMAEQGLAQAARLGLNPDQARRFLVYRLKIQDEMARRAAAGESTQLTRPSDADLRTLLGDGGYADFAAIEALGNPAAAAQAAADRTARPLAGPNSYYVPAGADQLQVAQAQGIDLRGVWSVSTIDPQGGVTLTRSVPNLDGATAPLTGPALGRPGP